MKRHSTHSVLSSGRSAAMRNTDDSLKGPRAVSPSESVIRNLLSYSRSLAVLQTKNSGYIPLVMN